MKRLRTSAWLLALPLFAGCNYQISKQLGVVLPTDRAPIFSELRTAVLAPKCFGCHAGAKTAGGISLETVDAMLADKCVVPLKPEQSDLFNVVADDSMPKGPNKLTKVEKEAVRAWIAAGAPMKVEDIVTAPPPPPDVEPSVLTYKEIEAKIINTACIRCHRGEKPGGDISLESYEKLVEGDDPILRPGDADGSLLYTVVRDDEMPKKTKLSDEQKEMLRRWIAEGAKKN